MSKRMLIDATHAEETRVVVMDGNRLVDFDVETSTKKQNKGNIYLAKVVRVEPSLQAAFVEYGGNRHGFLAFSEIHPDYYQIPVADRERLLEMQAEELRQEQEREDREFEAGGEAALTATRARDARPSHTVVHSYDVANGDQPDVDIEVGKWLHPVEAPRAQPMDVAATDDSIEADTTADSEAAQESSDNNDDASASSQTENTLGTRVESVLSEEDAPPPETMGGDAYDARSERRIPPRYLRNYKIQEVIHRRQILLIQVVKEERGTKGAALTTYISLAGRFSVLMPNSPRGGGISRKITSAGDRKRLREVMDELALPNSMGMIVRTAGAGRPKPEIKRDCEYLLRLWDSIRETTLASSAPALIHEEANLIKRAIRDVYDRDVEDITVEGEDGYRAARDYMRMLMPSHVKKVQIHHDGGLPLFAKSGVENQLDAMHSPTVQLKSGGYLVINQTEALVAIDVNSGRSTRERGIEETALRTNMEAAEEAARQLRLRDLAGLIVIDFIDMEARKHNAMVERKLKEALKLDRARIQVGHISHFGLLEMSRQRLRPSLSESNFIQCPHCQGTGTIRSVESSAVHVLRAIEEEGGKRRASEIQVRVAGEIAFYILNHKRERLAEIEDRFGMKVVFLADETLRAPGLKIERLKAMTEEQAAELSQRVVPEIASIDGDLDDDISDDDDDADAPTGDAATTESAEDGERRRRRRRRRRGGRRDDANGDAETSDEAGEEGEQAAEGAAKTAEADASDEEEADTPPAPTSDGKGDEEGRRRRRGRRGGRRRRRDDEGSSEETTAPAALSEDDDVLTAPPAAVAPYAGPTPADPFGGQVDIFDVMDAAERAAEVPVAPVAKAIPIQTSAPVAEAVVESTAMEAEAIAEEELLPPAELDVPAEEEAKPAKRARSPRSPRTPRAVKTAAEKTTTTRRPRTTKAAAAAEATALEAAEAPVVAVANPVENVPAKAEPAPAVTIPEATLPEGPMVSPPVQPKVIDTTPNPDAPKRKGWWKA